LDESYDTRLKVNPPLRRSADAKALRAALVEGVIDVLATDHAPHAAHEKALEFELAPFGTTGLETALGLVYGGLVAGAGAGAGAGSGGEAGGEAGNSGAPGGAGSLSLASMVVRMSVAPRRILGLEPVRLEAGSVADLTVFDPEARWTVTAANFASKSANSAFIGHELQGRATDVYVNGYASLENGNVVE
jgi:dihydroorotase